MPQLSDARHKRVKAAVAIALSFAAGCADVIGYISFGHSFIAHMTGNTVHLGEGLIEANWMQVGKAAALIAAFLAGSIFTRSIIEAACRLRVRSIAVIALALEAGLIAAAVFSWRHELQSLLLLAAAMGVQTAVLTRVGSLTVHTTFVTGMLNKLAQLLSHASFLTYDQLRGSPTASKSRSKVLAESRFMFGVWFLYLLGAGVGTLTRSRWGISALWLPVVLVCLIALVDLISPLAIEEERDTSER
jgi:uncharacterized membrane protein YoaK (UPF0700 family)